ncbi:MAG: hypothetical protein JWP31_1740, partial [Aeromicrobium sp.]|nr:hypothetical protein [Aeromicrobium sp.]
MTLTRLTHDLTRGLTGGLTGDEGFGLLRQPQPIIVRPTTDPCRPAM